MGCSTSHSNDEGKDDDSHQSRADQINFMTPELEKLLISKQPQDLLKAFMLLDKAIMDEENRSPSSMFGQAMTRQQQLKTYLHSAMETKTQNEFLSGDSSIYDLFNDLGITRNPKLAPEHEEFFASVNRRAINEKTIEVLQKLLQTVEEQIKTSSARISQLQSAYHQQDELLGQVFGETYGSESERLLEKELDTMRYYRDTLAMGVLQWEVCAGYILKAANLLQKAVASWTLIKNQTLEKKISLATESRNYLMEAVLLIQTSEELLQDVQFPFCTTRELRGISQAVDYVFTDILIEERYSHATEVYKNFLERATSLQGWIKQVLNSKLQKDLFEIEERVSKSAAQLRNERIFLICKKLKIKNPDENFLKAPIQVAASKDFEGKRTNENIFDYDKFPVNLESKLGFSKNQEDDSNVQSYFRKIVENRKNTMWPSRRIDELQSLMMQE